MHCHGTTCPKGMTADIAAAVAEGVKSNVSSCLFEDVVDGICWDLLPGCLEGSSVTIDGCIDGASLRHDVIDPAGK